MNKNKINELSRFISKLLRHDPELANIDINIKVSKIPAKKDITGVKLE